MCHIFYYHSLKQSYGNVLEPAVFTFTSYDTPFSYLASPVSHSTDVSDILFSCSHQLCEFPTGFCIFSPCQSEVVIHQIYLPATCSLVCSPSCLCDFDFPTWFYNPALTATVILFRKLYICHTVLDVWKAVFMKTKWLSLIKWYRDVKKTVIFDLWEKNVFPLVSKNHDFCLLCTQPLFTWTVSFNTQRVKSLLIWEL